MYLSRERHPAPAAIRSAGAPASSDRDCCALRRNFRLRDSLKMDGFSAANALWSFIRSSYARLIPGSLSHWKDGAAARRNSTAQTSIFHLARVARTRLRLIGHCEEHFCLGYLHVCVCLSVIYCVCACVLYVSVCVHVCIHIHIMYT